MSLRRTIAKWLCPEVFEESRRYHWLKMQMQEGHRWLGEFSPIEAFIERIWDSETNRYRALSDEPKISKWRSEIYDFREQLRRPATP